MQRILLSLALIAAAGTAIAQTSRAPPTGNPPDVNQAPTSVDANTANASGHPTGQALIAQKRIEADGYKNVQGIALGSDGLWHGRAMRGSSEVQVTVDKQGNVTQQ
jgi:hypothetical protein